MQGLANEYCDQLSEAGCDALLLTSRSGYLSMTAKTDRILKNRVTKIMSFNCVFKEDIMASYLVGREEMPFMANHLLAAGFNELRLLLDSSPGCSRSVLGPKVR